MTLNFEADQPVVGLKRQQALIRAVLGASSADESRWLELKSQHDVSKAEGAFAVAKAVLGFANRSPDVAAQWADGHAYLLVGVDEEALYGVTPHDIEKVDSWLGRYLGDFDRYQFTYVPFDNGEGTQQVMLVDVFPPRWGDPIHTLRKEFQNFYPGTIFHRYAGKTQPARPPEIEALTDRARRAAQRIDVTVDPANATIAVNSALDGVRQEARNLLQKGLLRQLDEPQPKPPFGPMSGLAGTPERRTRDEFRDEVEEFLDAFEATMDLSLAHEINRLGSPLRLRLANPGETFIKQVEVILRFPDTVQACLVAEEEVDWPTPPATFGSWGFHNLTHTLGSVGYFNYARADSQYPEMEYENGHLIIRYPAVDLRPHTTMTLDPVALHSTREASEPVQVEWCATATNVSGTVRRNLSIPVQRMDISYRLPHEMF